MRLTQVLNITVFKPRTYRGLTYQGKHQKVKKIRTSYKAEAANFVAMEAQNLAYLNKPFLSIAQEEIYDEINQTKEKKKRAALIKSINDRGFFPNRTLEEHLKPLLQNKKWE